MSNTNTPEGAREAAVVADYQRLFAEVTDQHADYHAWMDEIDPFTATRPEMIDLMESAPSDLIKGYLFGIYTMRIQMAAVTGRAYE